MEARVESIQQNTSEQRVGREMLRPLKEIAKAFELVFEVAIKMLIAAIIIALFLGLTVAGWD